MNDKLILVDKEFWSFIFNDSMISSLNYLMSRQGYLVCAIHKDSLSFPKIKELIDEGRMINKNEPGTDSKETST